MRLDDGQQPRRQGRLGSPGSEGEGGHVIPAALRGEMRRQPLAHAGSVHDDVIDVPIPQELVDLVGQLGHAGVGLEVPATVIHQYIHGVVDR